MSRKFYVQGNLTFTFANGQQVYHTVEASCYQTDNEKTLKSLLDIEALACSPTIKACVKNYGLMVKSELHSYRVYTI
jgi:hypothetical protein